MGYAPEDGTRYLCSITGHGVDQADNSNAVYLWCTFSLDHEVGEDGIGEELQDMDNGSTRVYLLNKEGSASEKHVRATKGQLKTLGFEGDVNTLPEADLIGNQFEATCKYNDRGYVDWDFRKKRGKMAEDAVNRLQAIYGG